MGVFAVGERGTHLAHGADTRHRGSPLVHRAPQQRKQGRQPEKWELRSKRTPANEGIDPSAA